MTPAERNTAWALAQARQKADEARQSARTATVMAALSKVAAVITAWAVLAS